MQDDPRSGPTKPTRREFLRNTGGTAAAAVIAGYAPVSSDSAAGQGAPPTTSAERPNIEGVVPVTLRVNGKDRQLRVDPRTTLLDCLRETSVAHRNEEGLRSRPMRRMHGARRRPTRAFMPEPGRDARRRRHHDYRGAGHTRGIAPHAGGLRCPRRLSVRLLHVRPDHVGRGAAQGTVRS